MKIKEQLVVAQMKEEHFKVELDGGREVFVSVYSKSDEFDNEYEVEIFKGKEYLTPDEQEEVIEYVSMMYKINLP